MTGNSAIDVPLPSPERRQTIGAFARAVGLSASALRQYGESGLLVPAEVDERTGYRCYAPDQQRRAIWIRRLRDAGLTLHRIGAILDGDAGDAERMLKTWLTDTATQHETAAELVADLTLALRARRERNPVQRTSARLDGAVLADAMEQVAAGASTDPDADPASVLLELGAGGVTAAATDRHLLLARLAIAADVEGPPARLVISTRAAATWSRTRRRVTLIIDAPTGRDADAARSAMLRDDSGAALDLSPGADLLPSVHGLIPAEDRAAAGVPTLLLCVGIVAGAVIPSVILGIPLAARERGWSATEAGLIEAGWVAGGLAMGLWFSWRGTAARTWRPMAAGPLVVAAGLAGLAVASGWMVAT